MRKYVKSVLAAVLPGSVFARVMSMHSRNHQMKYLRGTRDLEIAERLVAACGSTVLHGPFQGQIYPKEALVNRLGAPLLLGSYEQELHKIFAGLSSSYDCYIDVGAGAGHYAVGMARKSGGGKVFAYETDPRELAYCREMARLNRVEQTIEFGSWCDEQEIVKHCENRRCFVLSDCEGYEHDLFGPRAVDALKRSDVVIELHNRPGINMRDAMQQRFAQTHDMEVLSIEPRRVEDYPEAKLVGELAEQAIIDQRLPHQQWLHCRAR